MTQVSLVEVGISQDEAAEFLDALVEDNGGLSEETLMKLLLKVAVAKAILEKALETDPIVVTLEDLE